MDNVRSFAIQRFAVDLLESIDNFDRALSVVPADKLSNEQAEVNKELQELHQGLRMTESILLNTLKKHGLERFDPAEHVDGQPQKFDPQLHEATFMAKAEGKENGDIMFVQSKGYRLNGRVLRVRETSYHWKIIHLLTFSLGCQSRCRQERVKSPSKLNLSPLFDRDLRFDSRSQRIYVLYLHCTTFFL